ncbi:lipocalin family protein [Nostoc sp.]|uniref:lipocalin family protein n=1 Tax=Nostoc sp. TaxID=1180 RepID=UPI002FF8CDAA
MDRDLQVTIPTAAMQGESASKEGNGLSLFVSTDPDLVAKPGANLDSWFLVGNLESDRGTMYLLVHLLHVTPPTGDDLLAAMVSVLNPQTNKYIAEEQDFPGEKCSFNTEKFEVITPIASASGTTSALNFKGNWSKAGIEVDVTAQQTGPLLPNVGNGLFPCLGGITYHYALPTMSVTGTVSISGDRYKVTGDGWLDRQWGVTPRFFGKEIKKWVWFGIILDSGDRISVWEFIEEDRPVHSWATVVRLDGGVDVVACDPMTANASNPWKSPETGHIYPINWDIRIPQLDGHLIIRPEVIEQEFVSPVGMHKYEGFSAITGTLRGKPVTGRVIIELVADWL